MQVKNYYLCGCFLKSKNMIQSMTGYGKAEVQLESGRICIEIRTLNSKNADINIKTQLLPKDKEMAVRHTLADKLHRGTIDFFMTFEPNAAESAKEINAPLALAYYRQIAGIADRISNEFHSHDSIDTAAVLAAILRFPDVMDTRKQEIITEENWPSVEAGINEAIDRTNEFRSREGAVLYKDVTSKVSAILSYVDQVESHESERIDAIKEKILSRFEELSLEADQSRLEQEMIYYIEKLDINEEKTRLRQHCHYFMETIDNEPYPGKKLGFIAQEMGREINTTGSKANHSGIQKIVVKMKDDLEKIKEQSLNIL